MTPRTLPSAFNPCQPPVGTHLTIEGYSPSMWNQCKLPACLEVSMQDWKNKLYFGDNLDILRQHIADESIDLIYLDPPFNSNELQRLVPGEGWRGLRRTNHGIRRYLALGLRLRVRLSARGRERSPKARRFALAFRTFLGQKRHDGVPGDGSAASGGSSTAC